MRLSTLTVFFLFFFSVIKAQDVINTLVITEARMDRNDHAYIEITNMGTEPVLLSHFEFGRVGAWDQPFSPPANQTMMLPDFMLQPGESYTIASVFDFTEKMFPVDPENYSQRVTKKEWWEKADLQIHQPEQDGGSGNPLDSISEESSIMDVWGGRDCWYLRHHVNDSTAFVVDQVGGVFGQDDGTNEDGGMFDVAGVTGATGNSTLVRKFSVKTGNTDFANARGVGAEDSEWIVLPHLYQSFEPWRALFWSAGNHGDYILEETTLVSDVLSVDWENHTITAPWGTRNNDDFMALFEKTEGIAWHYHLSEDPGSLKYNAARTGDRLTVYACGDVLQEMTFDIIVAEPDASANLVIPMFAPQSDGTYSSQINSGNDEVFEVTENMPVMDTITKSIFGIPFATRIDSLLKYLEKAPAAEWEFVWVDGTARPDLKNGDILKVTSENGSEKDYFIKVNNYVPGQDASLDAITWPDIPAYYYGIFGWKGDTIPNFESATYNYKVEVPAEVEGIPALTAKTQDVNATVQISRATNLNGTKSQRTYTFTVTAEDGINQRTYSVELEKDVLPEDNQPFHAEPFLSELVFQDQWANGFVEICNPGSELLDLRDYMMVFTAGSPVEAITGASGVDDWSARYIKYVPGYKWVGEVEWAVSPGLLVPDLNVNPIVQADDVFVMGQIDGTAQSGYPWFASEACDVIFDTEYNPWGETYDHSGSAAKQWSNNNFYIFKILNDSIKQGLKPANDPADFELIEVFGYGFESQWVVGGVAAEQITNYLRKPEYIQGNNNLGGSFGTNPEDSEWTWTNRTYWQSQGYNWPQDILMVASDLGKHYFNAPTLHLSTITSPIYKVSKGYSMNETIEGVTTGTTVAEFLGNIIKADDGQTLTVKRGTDGAGISGEDPVSLNDTLVVVSANGTNTTKYILDVSETGLSSDAIITSAIYQVVVDEAGSSVSGFSYGTMLRTVINNITVPDRATLTVINEDDEPVPLKVLNFENTYVNALATPEIYLEVVAEDNINTIVYQLIPISTASDAFVLSDVFNVNQNDSYIRLIPEGITVAAFFSNLIPSSGAAMKVVDKWGTERTTGTLAADDKLVVTSADSSITKIYTLLFGDEVFIPTVLALNTTVNTTSSSITLEIIGTGGTPSYQYKAILCDGQGANCSETPWQQSNTIVFDGLQASTTYTVETQIMDSNENTASENIGSVTTDAESCDPQWTVINYTNSTTAYCQVTIEGVPAAVGDKIGAFVGDECRGIGNIVIDNSIAYSTILIQGEIIETVTFKVWDTSECAERDVCGSWQTNPGGNIGYPPDYLITNVCTDVTQTVEVSSGWNLNSFYVDTGEETLENLFGSLGVNILQVKSVTQSWDPLVPSYLNTLTKLSNKEIPGFFIKAENAGSFDITGPYIGTDHSNPLLNAGWNLIGYPYDIGQEVTAAYQSLLSDSYLEQVKSMSESYDPDVPSHLNTLTLIEPGNGYFINVNTPVNSFIYPESAGSTKSSHISAVNATGWEFTGYPESMIAYGKVTFDDLPVTEDAYVGAFVGQECRAVTPIIIHEGESFVSMVINGTEEENVEFRLWKEGIVYESTTTLTSRPGGSTEDIIPISFKSFATATDLISWAKNTQLSTCPNPFNRNLNINVRLTEPDDVEVKIFSADSRLIRVFKKSHAQAGMHNFIWDANDYAGNSCAPGMYFIHLNTSYGNSVQKVLFAK